MTHPLDYWADKDGVPVGIDRSNLAWWKSAKAFDLTVGAEKGEAKMDELNLTDTETRDLRVDLLKIVAGLPHVDSAQIVNLAREMESFVTGKKEGVDVTVS